MKCLQILLLIFSPFFLFSYFSLDSIVGLTDFQKEINADYANPAKSPLLKKDLETFKSLDFFPFDEKHIITARFVRTENSPSFEMETTTDRKPVYQTYGVAYFQIDSVSYQLNIYQNQGLLAKEEYKDYLFLPFTDLTNGDESYGGGRFIDLKIPTGDSIIIDFNKAYNPYCAYSNRYSCPIPPAGNYIDVAIKAGVKKFH